MLKFVSRIALALVLGATAGAASAASGTAMGVDPSAEAQGKQTRTLVVGADIFIGDRVVTGPQGQVQILFSDSTRLVVGPRSSLLIEDYLLRENGSAGKFAINALSGTFRFVTGGAPKDRYVITTPTGTIGVRGTEFDLWVGQTALYQLLYHGSTINCPPGVPIGHPSCVIATDTCDLVQVSSNLAELLGHADNVTGQARNQLRSWFIYAVNQRPLLRQFRIQNAERCVNRPAGGGGAPSLSTPPSGGGQPQQQPDPIIINNNNYLYSP
jgi:hypothetical protein